MPDVVRLRPAHDRAVLGQIYATPHRHTAWPDHRVRVAATAQFADALTGHVATGADLSCGDGAVLQSMDMETRYFGDYAPGYALHGPIEHTITKIPPVDVFVHCETLEHLDNPAGALKLIRDKTSALVLSTPVDAFDDNNVEHYWAWSRQGVEAMLDDAGFVVKVYMALDFRPSECPYQFGVWYCR